MSRSSRRGTKASDLLLLFNTTRMVPGKRASDLLLLLNTTRAHTSCLVAVQHNARARDLAETIPGTHPNLNRGQDTRANRTRYLDTFKLWGPRKARPVYCRVNTSPLLRDKRSGIARAPNSVLWGRKGVYSTDPSTVAGIRFVN